MSTAKIVAANGAPDSEEDALQAARRYQHPIHTIYIGPENGHGRAFLTRLARATGGQTFQSTAPGLLGDGVERLLLAA